jgi:hypothetical protein
VLIGITLPRNLTFYISDQALRISQMRKEIQPTVSAATVMIPARKPSAGVARLFSFSGLPESSVVCS